MPSVVTESALRALFANLGRYLANLARAGSGRKHESRKALQGVILATRQTRIYLRALKDGKGKKQKQGKENIDGKSAKSKANPKRRKTGGGSKNGGRDYAKEEQLSLLWTRLSFELRELGVTTLAKRCDIAGRYWIDPDNFSLEFLTQARARLEDLEQEARVLLKKTG